MRIQIINQLVEISEGRVICSNADLQELLASIVSTEGFFFGTFFRSHASRDIFIGEKLVAQFDGQLVSLDPASDLTAEQASS